MNRTGFGDSYDNVSIGIETGPLIGAQKGPFWSDVSWPEAA
jgi:hypothetical protein